MMLERTFDAQTCGAMVRAWRGRRRLSQMELAEYAEISTRHLSFIDTNRAMPSRDVIARLSESLEIPLAERNALLLAAGYAPVYTATALDAPAMEPITQILQAMLSTPTPTCVVDRCWNILDMNAPLARLTEGVAAHLTAAPPNALRIALHPDGLAPRILNFREWADHLLDRLRREERATGDPRLRALLDELSVFAPSGDAHASDAHRLAVPLRLRYRDEELAFVSTIATFGTPVDITVAQLMIESFFPANDAARRFVAGNA